MAQTHDAPPGVMNASFDHALEPLPSHANDAFLSSPDLALHPPHPSSLHPNADPAVLGSNASRSYSRSPVRGQLRSASNPHNAHPTLSSVRSNPVLLPSRQPGTVRDIANRFDRGASPTAGPPLRVETTQERYRRAQASKAGQKSPTTTTKVDPGMTKLQKRRPAQHTSPQRSPATSFDNSSSFASNGSATSSKSQLTAVSSSRKPASPIKPTPHPNSRPLFGELTADGWHGNFELPGYEALPTFQHAPRRRSDGNAALSHGRSQSHQDIGRTLSPSPARHPLTHKRSRSEMDGMRPQPAPSMPNLNSQNIPPLYPTPPDSASRNMLRKDASAPKTASGSRRPSEDTARTQPRSASTGPERRRLSKSPTRPRPPQSRDTPAATATTAVHRSRYQPPPISTSQPQQTLSAKIVAPQPKISPPLRSSRPRQPVSSATTSASRARAAERFQKDVPKDSRRPSEQWLGKPYDPQKERTRRKIPELGNVDFAERRARIQRAISQNLDRQSKESLRSQSRSRQASADRTAEGARAGASNEVDATQAEILNEEMDEMEAADRRNARARGLSVDTRGKPEPLATDSEPGTATSVATEFEVDESPVLGRDAGSQLPAPAVVSPQLPEQDPPLLLSAVAYQPPSARLRTPEPQNLKPHISEEGEHGAGMFNVAARRAGEQIYSSASREGTEFGDDSPSGETSPSDLEDRWGLGHTGLGGDQGSIRIMLDEETTAAHLAEPWTKQLPHGFSREMVNDAALAQRYNDEAFSQNGFAESPIDDHEGYVNGGLEETPRKGTTRDRTLTPDGANTHPFALQNSSEQVSSDEALARAIDQYQKTGLVAPQMLAYLQDRCVDLQRLSANGGSDGIMVQNLLDSVLDLAGDREVPPPKPRIDTSQPMRHDIPLVTPDTPPDAAIATGTAVVFQNGHFTANDEDEEEDFHEKIRKADEAWERQQRGEYAMLGALDDDRPIPPPKDAGYTPRSSSVPNSATFPPYLSEGLRISTAMEFTQDVLAAAGDVRGTTPANDRAASPRLAPPLPAHAPPPPPPPPSTIPISPTASRMPFGMPEPQPIPASHSERSSNEFSPRARKNVWAQSGSSRPSVDSQRAPAPPSLPGSQSMSSFADSTRQDSMDTPADSQTRLVKTNSPGPEQKRLMKRRHIIRELLDTEYTYHQDLKIIEDIYKATVGDLVSAEDKKTLFGNCDDIERFSLRFYDELRKAVASVYVPPKQMRWANKRGSFSTMQSDATGPTSVASNDCVDEEKDRTTTVGQCFLANLQRMDQVYGAYLKNHDAANQRLSALKNTPTVKCWLEECHNNASDITSAWDLDSLLVKPTQRVSKYPMLLTQLLETTPAEHPDYEALKTAAKDVIGMLTRINEAKKRADIVDKIINRKGKDSDMRSGIAKAFGRRTEKLKERVGIAEAFQDAEFDELSHKFGGHYIRMQICMRDVQDYMNRIDKAMEQINSYAAALEAFTDVSQSSLPEIESKWRKYSLAIREITAVAFPEHKAAVNNRVIQPMIKCIQMHEGPQNAINKRKKRIVDYAKCKSIEKRGDKPDKKTLEASEMYVVLNEQLKLELPKLYTLTASLVQACLNCFVDIQIKWYNMWERKLQPILDASDLPTRIDQIEPAFHPDYELVKARLLELAICNGALLADSANFLSPVSTLRGESSDPSSLARLPTSDSGKRTLSVGSESSPIPPAMKRLSSGYGINLDGAAPGPDGRGRSDSSLSTRGTPVQTSANMANGRSWSSANTPASSLPTSRPSTANPASNQQSASSFYQNRQSADDARSLRPTSGQTYFTARPEASSSEHRFSGLFSSALPPDLFELTPTPKALYNGPPSSADVTDADNEEPPVMFVCASLFEFSIDKTRKEAGYPYLTYAQGEVFDVIAQKGELWLAKNQDDPSGTLGWIWEQHFVILSVEM